MNNIKSGIFCAIFLMIVSGVIEVQSQNITEPPDMCNTKMSCRDCIQTKNCAWCLQTNYDNRPRCFHQEKTLCKDIWNPKNEALIRQNEALTKKKTSTSSPSTPPSKIVQISPQHISLKLRLNEVYKMDLNYSQAEDYPVDLYYLMDLSSSMSDDKAKLSKLGNLLAETMVEITTNFRLGFGSFVDKVLMPFTSTVPKKLLEPCPGCAAPFGFRNNMPLSNNTKQFAIEVELAEVSGNIDTPEGGFDALMQAIVCQKEIGWRTQARRLVLFTTDAGFHHAGDGKLAGVVMPNDGLCHLENDYYTLSSEQDYPSISHINLKAKEKAVNVIFAVTEANKGVYEKLSNLIEGSSSSVLSSDSSNIVDVVRNEYNKISSSVEMKDDAPSYIKIVYYSKCLGDKRIRTNKCDGLKVGSVVTFEIEIVATSCPELEKKSFKIYSVGIDESLTVDLELLCSCPCEQKGIIAADECKSHGTLLCGNCECEQYYYGRNCECSKDDPDKHQHQCRPDNITEIDCSGRGSCVCGLCDCEKRENKEEEIKGEFCQCDNYSCERENGVACSGKKQGICDCGSCSCKEGWTGPACQYTTSNVTCIDPKSKEKLCSGHGSCVYGKCECENDDCARYTGEHCEIFSTCPGRCDELKSCVECQMYKDGNFKDEKYKEKIYKDPKLCFDICGNLTVIGVDTLNSTESGELCTSYIDNGDCRYHFVYKETEGVEGVINLAVRAQKYPKCPDELPLPYIAAGVVGAIVLLGLAMLLLWKLLTSVHDRREYTRFEKEKAQASWEKGDNPLYKEAKSTFMNPTFND